MNQSSFKVREAVPADLPAVVAVDRELWGPWANPITLYRQLLELCPELMLVASSSSGEYAGCATGLIRTNPVIGLVLSIDITPKYQRMGLGRLFLTELIVRLKHLGAGEVKAVIDPENSASKQLFSACGFTHVSHELDYFGKCRDQELWNLKFSEGTYAD